MMQRSFVAATLLAIACIVSRAALSNNLKISRAATHNVACSGGVCSPTGRNPVLNVNDLKSLLKSGNVQVVNNGRTGFNGEITVRAPLKWSASTTLTLSATDFVHIDAPVSVAGTGGLSIPCCRFYLAPPRGRITFSNLSSSFAIGGVSYTLVATLPSLVTAVAANPSGAFALANSYDASGDGTYTSSPISTNFLGAFEGLRNTISNVSVNDTSDCCVGGLFLSLSEAHISDLLLNNVAVSSTGGAAGLAYESFAEIDNVSVTGSVTGGSSGDVGGLVSDNYGQIYDGYSTATVSAGSTVTDVNVGGLVGFNLGGVGGFATGNVSAGDGSGNLGGLVGLQQGGGVGDCYATGTVTGGTGMKIGGLLGWNAYSSNGSPVHECYSTGAISGGSGSLLGGFIGENEGDVSYGYFDTSTSGTNVGVALGNASGVTGLTTGQLQSGLPPGFEQGVWAENSSINNGFPYLIYDPPPQ